MSKIGFFDHHGNLMATTEGEASFAPLHRGTASPTMVLKMDSIIVAREEDIDGLRWVVETKLVKIVERSLVERASLAGIAPPFCASSIKTLD